MNTSASTPAAREINRLHDESVRLADASQQSLHAALAAAWQAGQLLLVEKKRVRRKMGGAWLLWLEQYFHGTPRTAQNYMRLAQSVADLSRVQGMSLRQAYIHLGISTAPKSDRPTVRVSPLPAHVRLAAKLVCTLKAPSQLDECAPEQSAAYRQDLRTLYEHLRRLFEPMANNPTPTGSKSA